eukprot:120429-Amphidinium_carterae.2
MPRSTEHSRSMHNATSRTCEQLAITHLEASEKGAVGGSDNVATCFPGVCILARESVRVFSTAERLQGEGASVARKHWPFSDCFAIPKQCHTTCT